MTKKMNASLLAFLIVFSGLAVRALFMLAKDTWHVDESISVGLTDDNWPKNPDTGYKGRWISKAELDTAVFDGKLGSLPFAPAMKGITAQTAADVHPPLYYWLYGAFRMTFGVQRHALAGFILNALLFVLSCVLLHAVAMRVWNDRLLSLALLAAFAFSSGGISSTLFMRMYELLQTLCLLFLYGAVCVLYPRKGSRLAFPLAALFASSFLGLLTHYYFLYFIAPVALFALVFLALKKHPAVLLWSLLAVVAGLYLAFKVFPAMEMHLFSSYRGQQSASNLSKITGRSFWKNTGAYLGILSSNLVWQLPLVVLAVLSAAVRFLPKRIGVGAWLGGGTGASGGKNIPAAILFALTAVFVFLLVSLSAPYQTGRYVVSFFPVFILGYAALLKIWAPPRAASLCAGVLAALVIAGTCVPPAVNQFHEDYVLDGERPYLYDEKPVIIVSTADAWVWKNMLLYKNLGKDKRVFVVEYSGRGGIETLVAEAAASSGSSSVYVFADDYIMKKPLFARVGFYGFFEVYRYGGN